MPSPYDVLGIDPDADEAEVVRAYRRRVKEAHPDQGGSAREFRAVQSAYERLLSDEALGSGHGQVESGAGPGRRGGAAAGRGRRGRDDTGPDREGADETDSDSDAGPDPEPVVNSRVEYLAYGVLDDHGWRLDDPDLFAKADALDLSTEDYGQFLVEPPETLLEAAENRGHAWPFACRGGACANCAVAVVEGELSLPIDHVLSGELVDRGFRLSCNGVPLTPELKVVFDVKHLPELEELRLPPYPFDLANADD